MNGKKLAVVLGLVALIIAIPAGYVLAHPSGYYYEARAEQYQDEDWWQEMRQYMEERWADEVDGEWWAEMRAHMENRWNGVEDEEWFQEMQQYMEERWQEQDRYGDSWGYGRRGGCHW